MLGEFKELEGIDPSLASGEGGHTFYLSFDDEEMGMLEWALGTFNEDARAHGRRTYDGVADWLHAHAVALAQAELDNLPHDLPRD